jgi:hypothetical protein
LIKKALFEGFFIDLMKPLTGGKNNRIEPISLLSGFTVNYSQ